MLKYWTAGGVFDPAGLQSEIKSLEDKTCESGFWNNREKAEETMGKLKVLRGKYEPWKELKDDLEEVKELYTLALEESDESLEGEILSQVEKIEKRFPELKLLELLGDELDDSNAFLMIHSGAGGTEACDWVSMLYRMYQRWTECRGFNLQILDLQEAEGGIKSVTCQINGQYVHGYLKGESGIHRLVRISPFDSSSRRHTSFASVYVTPVIEEDIEVDIRPEDIRVDTYRAQGAGGQHVNKTDSAVRITHLETRIVVQCQNERSQHKNRANAMKVLKSRLYEHYKAERNKEQQSNLQEKKDISWGNQIRSYVFQPYTMVKDHRTKHEAGNIQSMMDGNIDSFIESYLHWKWSGRS